MKQSNNIILAVAGSGKTTKIVNDVLSLQGKKCLIVTYTINNIGEIKRKFFNKIGAIPENVTIMPWFTFLLRNFVRPYQNILYEGGRICGICMIPVRSAKFTKKNNIKEYHLSKDNDIYPDKISEFGCRCNELTNGLVISRLEKIYDYIFIDEIQDLAGYDLGVLELLLYSKIPATFVGDHRQSTYQTNASTKNSQFSKHNIIKKFEEWRKKGLCTLIYTQNCYRCNENICEFANSIYPQFPKSISQQKGTTGHDGFFLLSLNNVDEYIKRIRPVILRYDRKTKCALHDEDAINFGESKGLTFDHVLIFPNGPLQKVLKTGDFSHIQSSPAKYYVAITRAKYSIAFVYNGECNLAIRLNVFTPTYAE